MNRANLEIINLLKSANQKYRDDVSQICLSYIKQRNDAKTYAEKYKDETEIFRDSMRGIIQKSRNELHEKQKWLSELYAAQTAKLSDSVQEALMHALNSSFLQRIRFYHDSGLKPTRSEIEALITLAEGHLVALSGIDKMLRDNGSSFALKYVGIQELENDLESLRKFAKLIPATTNLDQAEALIQILGDNGKRTIVVPNPTNALGDSTGEGLVTEYIKKGEPVKRLNRRGEIVENGETFSLAIANLESLTFEKMESQLNEMESRWGSVTSPAIEMLYKQTGAIETSTEIVESEPDSTKLAKVLGQEAGKEKGTVLKDFAK